MYFEWTYEKEVEISLKAFLKAHDISRRLLAKVKFHGGQLLVNGKEETVRYVLKNGDCIRMVIPKEEAQPNVIPVFLPIDILYEDEHVLAVNKPAGVASIPSYLHPKYSMANRVKGYFVQNNNEHQVIHIVTRLDKDTSGVMLFAKHQFAHGQLDKQLRAGQVDKQYIAIAQQSDELFEYGVIDAPIGRVPDSIMTRQVIADGSGKEARTEYWLYARGYNMSVYKIKLHTGRTHQIRVHFTHKKATLIGDDLYGGRMDTSLQRQALHCEKLVFKHPFSDEIITCHAPMPKDMQVLVEKCQIFDRNGIEKN
ncbi:RluA family pseudouridine synthase [Granulicatella sp. zg-ZJ]|uniref:RluA family pseudouridine synthase n=1 Tax=Granulicatella sp. zg-ZJ TaxID=2678504 RepID=UPI0013D778C0|nr:RluA family pseudouridine synthase [Granulicatella sp. zg-ZJ]NEW61887.1 RluA family pseudouridine synthase [Granulicatella sp. zg-ZJ]